MALFQKMAIECLGPVPSSQKQFRIQAPESGILFVQSSLIEHWKSQEYTVFLMDPVPSDSSSSLPTLAYSIEKSQVVYERLPKKQVKREVLFTSHYTFTEPDGRVQADAVCSKSESDTLHRDALTDVESADFPVTTAPHPPKGWIQRYLEPVVLTTATALGVYLFFTLRSDSNDDGT